MTTTSFILILVASLLSVLSLPFSVNAATISVTTTTDVILDDGLCSLREAVIAANTNTVSGISIGECPAGSIQSSSEDPTDTIHIPAGTYMLTIPPNADNEYSSAWNGSSYDVSTVPDAAHGDLDITESVHIVRTGSGSAIIDGGWRPLNPATSMKEITQEPTTKTAGFGDRVFHIVATAEQHCINVIMSTLLIRGGKVGETTLPSQNDVAYSLKQNGAGIAVGVGAYASSSGMHMNQTPENNRYLLRLENTLLTLNYAINGGGIYNVGQLTGYLLNLSMNRANASRLGLGGGLYSTEALTITTSLIDNNGAYGGGGMFDIGTHQSHITATTISNNAADGGGGILSREGAAEHFLNVTISGNTAVELGGGICTNSPNTFHYTTIANNTTAVNADSNGAGIDTFDSAPLTFDNTLLAYNLKNGADGNCGSFVEGELSVISNGNNIDSGNTCALSGSEDLSETNPLLGDLANNGGPGGINTHALLPGSPAINSANNALCPETDQRGVWRPQGPVCDRGAFEVEEEEEEEEEDSGDDDEDHHGGACPCPSDIAICELESSPADADNVTGDSENNSQEVDEEIDKETEEETEITIEPVAPENSDPEDSGETPSSDIESSSGGDSSSTSTPSGGSTLQGGCALSARL